MFIELTDTYDTIQLIAIDKIITVSKSLYRPIGQNNSVDCVCLHMISGDIFKYKETYEEVKEKINNQIRLNRILKN